MPTQSLLPVIADATAAAQDDFDRALNEATAWCDWVEAGAAGAEGCVVCDSVGPLEGHHVAGRRHSELTVPVCVPCHRRLSERQDAWDPRWLSTLRSPVLDRTLVLRGLSDMCEERGERVHCAYVLLAKKMRARYARLARETIA